MVIMDNNIIGFIGIISICCICFIVNISAYKYKSFINYIFSLILLIISSMLFGVGTIINEINGVHPLDVYRNKTELQITYKIINNDTINCDSIVVFKNK